MFGKQIRILVILFLMTGWGTANAGTVKDCITMQSISQDDPLIIPPSDIEVQGCFTQAAVDSGNVLDCLFAPSPDVCAVGVADEIKDPSLIRAYVDSRFPDYQADRYEEYMADVTGHKELMVRDRNDLLMTLAGAYLSATGDFTVLDLFDGTYETYYRDQILQSSLAANVAASGYAPRADYCDHLSGGYLRNYYIILASETPEGNFLSNRQFCESSVAALRAFVNDADNCETELPARLRKIDGLTEDEITIEINDCKSLQHDLTEKLETFLKAFIESEGGNLDELLTRWSLTDTRVNPGDEKTKFIGGGADPTFFPEERFLGKLREFTVTDGSISFHDNDVDSGYLYFNATFVAEFDPPPLLMSQGEAYPLTGVTSGSGFVSENAGGWNSGITFEYRSDKGTLSGDTSAATNLDFITDTAQAVFTAPAGTEGEQLIIFAFLWNCAACRVEYVYTLKKFDLVSLFLTSAQREPMDLAHLKKYLDVNPGLIDAMNNMQTVSGVPPAVDSKRAGDLTSDGKAGIEDTIRIFQNLTE